MPDPLRDVSERETELVLQDRVRPRLLDGRQILARHVLDERKEERIAVVGLTHEGRHRGKTGRFRRTPTALARNELVAPVAVGANDDRLDDALRANGVGKTADAFGIDAPPRLARVRPDSPDGEVHEICVGDGAADQDVEPAP
jgi:hypothetical protein